MTEDDDGDPYAGLQGDPRLRSYHELTRKFVPHTRFRLAQEAVESVLELHGQDDVPCVIISGPAGVGKSTMIRRLIAEHAQVEDGRTIESPGVPDGRADHARILAVKMGPRPSELTFLTSILVELGDPRAGSGNVASVRSRAYAQLRACGVRCILVDDAQRAIDRSGTVVKTDLVEGFKTLHEETGVILVLVGLGRVKLLMEIDEQFERRFDAPIRLEPYRLFDRNGHPGDPDDRKAFGGLLIAMQKGVPFKFETSLTLTQKDPDAREDALLRFHHASRGLAGRLTKLLRHVSRPSQRRRWGDRPIGLEALAIAFSGAFDDERKGGINPFGKAWKGQIAPPAEDDMMLLPQSKATTKAARQRTVTDRLKKT